MSTRNRRGRPKPVPLDDPVTTTKSPCIYAYLFDHESPESRQHVRQVKVPSKDRNRSYVRVACVHCGVVLSQRRILWGAHLRMCESRPAHIPLPSWACVEFLPDPRDVVDHIRRNEPNERIRARSDGVIVSHYSVECIHCGKVLSKSPRALEEYAIHVRKCLQRLKEEEAAAASCIRESPTLISATASGVLSVADFDKQSIREAFYKSNALEHFRCVRCCHSRLRGCYTIPCIHCANANAPCYFGIIKSYSGPSSNNFMMSGLPKVRMPKRGYYTNRKRERFLINEVGQHFSGFPGLVGKLASSDGYNFETDFQDEIEKTFLGPGEAMPKTPNARNAQDFVGHITQEYGIKAWKLYSYVPEDLPTIYEPYANAIAVRNTKTRRVERITFMLKRRVANKRSRDFDNLRLVLDCSREHQDAIRLLREWLTARAEAAGGALALIKSGVGAVGGEHSSVLVSSVGQTDYFSDGSPTQKMIKERMRFLRRFGDRPLPLRRRTARAFNVVAVENDEEREEGASDGSGESEYIVNDDTEDDGSGDSADEVRA
ncbi:hypothetical protein HDU83_005002 [Entophlyctis luteolus]|nr:hypothetical protein HDU83_005002 [Entophlyctis luteolus]